MSKLCEQYVVNENLDGRLNIKRRFEGGQIAGIKKSVDFLNVVVNKPQLIPYIEIRFNQIWKSKEAVYAHIESRTLKNCYKKN